MLGLRCPHFLEFFTAGHVAAVSTSLTISFNPSSHILKLLLFLDLRKTTNSFPSSFISYRCISHMTQALPCWGLSPYWGPARRTGRPGSLQHRHSWLVKNSCLDAWTAYARQGSTDEFAFALEYFRSCFIDACSNQSEYDMQIIALRKVFTYVTI